MNSSIDLNNLHQYALANMPGSFAENYLLGRGYTLETIENFGIGFIPRKSSIGFWVKSHQMSYFEGRLFIPIYNESGTLVSYATRALDDSKPKYVNGPETDEYKKSELLYGANLLDYEIKPNSLFHQNTIFVVEGYADVWMLHQRGYNALAICGTALTEKQIKQIQDYSYNNRNRGVCLAFDHDLAGKNALDRALSMIAKQSVELFDDLWIWEPGDRLNMPTDIGEQLFQDDYILQYDTCEPFEFLQWRLEYANREEIQKLSEIWINLLINGDAKLAKYANTLLVAKAHGA